MYGGGLGVNFVVLRCVGKRGDGMGQMDDMGWHDVRRDEMR